MTSRSPLTGEDLVKALGKMGFHMVSREGSHAVLKYKNPDTGEKRTVTVPMQGELATGTLRQIAEQCGAKDFQEFKGWIYGILD